MAGDVKPAAPLGIVTDDEHIRVPLAHWNHIADTMQQQERTITQLRVRCAVLEQAAIALGDENAKLVAQLRNDTRAIMARHEQENKGNA